MSMSDARDWTVADEREGLQLSQEKETLNVRRREQQRSSLRIA